MRASEQISALLDAMAREGVRPSEPVESLLSSGRLVRFRCNGDKPGRRNGWARLGLGGWTFGHWRLGVRASGRIGEASGLTPVERARLGGEQAALEASRRREQAGAQLRGRETARALWEGAGAASAAHPYLHAKRMAPDGLRMAGRSVLVPMREPMTGELWNVQRIGPDGAKRFMAEARVQGLVWGRGTPIDRIALCEGMATTAAVHAATGLCAVAAFTKAELARAALALARRWPGVMMTVGADADADGGGEAAAREAAKAVGGDVAFPPRPVAWEGSGWDYADLWAAGEAAAIRSAFGMEVHHAGS